MRLSASVSQLKLAEQAFFESMLKNQNAKKVEHGVIIDNNGKKTFYQKPLFLRQLSVDQLPICVFLIKSRGAVEESMEVVLKQIANNDSLEVKNQSFTSESYDYGTEFLYSSKTQTDALFIKLAS